MSTDRQWLNLGLDALPLAQANRIRAFRLLLSEAAQLRGKLDRELAPNGVTSQQGAMLQWIEAQSEPPTIGEAAAGLRMTHQNVKQIALALERKGFVEIAADEHDGRVRRLRLTTHHRRFWKRRNPNDFASIESWTAVWSDEEIAILVALLSRLHHHLASI
jgi:DNA-binding MarR family transcriptional regulator